MSASIATVLLETAAAIDDSSEFWLVMGHRLKITDTLVVLLTFLLAGGTFLLWLATQRLVQSAEETARRQLRAYMAIAAAIPRNVIITGSRTTVLIAVQNMGQTPAR